MIWLPNLNYGHFNSLERKVGICVLLAALNKYNVTLPPPSRLLCPGYLLVSGAHLTPTSEVNQRLLICERI